MHLVSNDYMDGVVYTKNAISLVSLGNDMFGIVKKGELVNIFYATNTTITAIINQIKQSSDENLCK